MRRILFCVLFTIMTSAPRMSAQSQNSRLAYLEELSRHNQLPQLTVAANSLLADPMATPTEQGMALVYIGHVYQRGGDFHQATAYYEKALPIVNRDNLHPTEYAVVLGALATIYGETGQLDTAKHLLLQAVHIFEKENDHAKSAVMWNDLATIAAEEHSSREAHKYIEHLTAESQLANNIPDDQHAFFTMTKARIAEMDGDARTAIAEYQHALAVWKQSHSDQELETASLYVLLGGAYLKAGDIASARQLTTQGLHLLEAISGRETPRYLDAELAYAKVLDASGSHDEASKLRSEAQAALNANKQPARGEISVFALR